jgi:hypothetical protein
MALRMSSLRAGRPLPPGRFLVLISVRSWVDPGLEGLDQLKNPMTWGIEPATFQACSVVPHISSSYLHIRSWTETLQASRWAWLRQMPSIWVPTKVMPFELHSLHARLITSDTARWASVSSSCLVVRSLPKEQNSRLIVRSLIVCWLQKKHSPRNNCSVICSFI